MIRGHIAIPGASAVARSASSPRSASAIITPALRLRDQEANDNGHEQPGRSAIVQPKRKSNWMLAHLLDEVTDEERNRRADLGVGMFREIKRRAAIPERE